MISTAVAGLLALGAGVNAGAYPHECPPLKRGSFNIHQYQLYPENADWDANRCLVLFGVLWNASVAIYDPYKDKIVDTLTYPGITNSGSEHIGGVAWDKNTNLYTILVDAAAAWVPPQGADVTGDNLIMKYDPVRRKTLWTLNITAVTGGAYGGFQDVEHDARGNTYIVGTWPSSIMKVDAAGKAVTPWYPPQQPDHTVPGYGGLATVGDILLTNDGDGRLYKFDMREARGRPTAVPIRPNVLYDDNDAIYLPPVYGGRVLLLASHSAGIQVLRSRDARWEWAEHLGTIANPTKPAELFDGSAPVAAVQMGSGSVYMIDDWFADPWVEGQVAGNRSVFPMPDITAQIERLLK